MNKLQKLKLLSDLYGWKYLFLKTEDKLLGGDRAAAYGDERIVNADKSEYPRLLKALYKLHTGEVLNLDDPRSFNEKIQWLKLYDSTPMKTRLSDKYLVRDWVAEKIGEEYLIPLLGVWDSFDEIDFDTLPDQFALKCNHGSGMNEVVKDKASMNKAALKQKFDKWMATDYSIWGLELQYRDIPRKIIAEQYINIISEYQYYCFNGKPLFISCIIEPHGKNEKETVSLDFQSLDFVTSAPAATKSFSPPPFLQLMNIKAQTLCYNFPFVRVDFISTESCFLFNEMTFTPANGEIKWEPKYYDTLIGQYLQLQQQNNSDGAS